MPKTPDHRITIRLKPDEYALLVAKAGNKPLSAYLRTLTLEKAVAQRKAIKPAPVKDHRALSQILALLGQADFVHSFKHAAQDIQNGIEPTDSETKELLQGCKDQLNSIHSLLMHALGVSER